MISGLAPGSCVVTRIVGKSTCGNGATGSSGYATTPTSRIPAIRSEVAIGRAIKALEMLISSSFTSGPQKRRRAALGGGAVYLDASPGLQTVLPGRHDLFADGHTIIDDGNTVADLADF